ncbi:CdaR family transcriptional regulator [Micromonospora craterilacus]|uniref:CdaR family transcriptional regulator n=1 Tax=Micromonospora craterilacus TaxID=1655439 RepID=A0A2W2GBJ8_9ACTN|nr:helix-turn-helix domain-containing protein [Micromonospora craterilacus]PZG24144.1 CdaR family transcriptional regulator [Micromonospora craterilacus]
MRVELQRIVDAVAAHAGRPALIEDRRQRVVVYSEQTGTVDEVRRASILRRQTVPEVIAWLRDFGIADARAAVRTPACPELDLLPRLCVPVRHHDLLLGFVWFIDPDGTMADVDLAATGLLKELSLALYRENLLGELAAQSEAEAAWTLLADSPDTRDQAVRALLEAGMIAADGPRIALVARLVAPRQRQPDERARIALEQSLVAARRRAGTREALHLVRHDHGVLLLPAEPSAGRPTPEVAARHLDDDLQHVTRSLGSVERTVVGVGRTRPRLADVVESYGEALHAARIGAQLPTLGRVVLWSGLGIYRVLARLGEQQLTVADVHPGLARLLPVPGNQALLATLERYLDLAGNAHATAAELRLHRTTLYYRLQRIEELAGTDLKDGAERLCLHLALKLARLTGHHRPEG